MTASQYTIAGTVITMPVQIRKANQHMAMFSVDADAAQRLIDYSGLQVCRYLPGRAIVVLMFMHYIDGDLEQYHEFGTSVMVNPPGSNATRAPRPAVGRRVHLTTCPSTRSSRWKREPRSGATRKSWRTSPFVRAASSASTAGWTGNWSSAWNFAAACRSG